MKKLLPVALSLALLTGFIAATPLALTGCQQTTQKRAVTTLFSAHTAVDAAYQGYLRSVISGDVKTNSMPRVAAAYIDFQHAYNFAVELVASNTNATAPASVLSAAANFTTVLEQSKGN